MFLIAARTVAWTALLASPWCVQERPRELFLKGHKGSVLAVAFTPDGKHLFSSDINGGIRQWTAATGGVVADFGRTKLMIDDLAVSPDGTILAAAESSGLGLWEISTRKKIREFDAGSSIMCIAFNPDGTRVAVGTFEGGVRLFGVKTGAVIRKFKGTYPIYSVSFDAKGVRLAWMSGPELEVFDFDAGKSLWSIKAHDRAASEMAFHPDGKTIASGSDDGTLKIWSADTGERVRTLPQDGMVTAMAWSPDGRTLAAGITPTAIALWNPETGERLRLIEKHRDNIHKLAFSKDGRWMASAGSDEMVGIFFVGKN